ncbi:hypothetical protein BGZ46_006531 [Entomortierella lignicola]|nr:hypothetical protein BGZ46_006531 [Entomortierella lignicola]
MRDSVKGKIKGKTTSNTAADDTEEDARPWSRKEPISLRTQIDTTSAVMRTCRVYSTKVTHTGRHAGTSEAYHLGLNPDHVLHLGRWCMGQMVTSYAPKNPTAGAFYMAHFNKRDEPYFIKRDLVTPPLPLQRPIFPWIEHSFNKDQPHLTEGWIKECNIEMGGLDVEVTEDDTFWEPDAEPLQGDPTSSKTYDTVIISRIAFLKLLVRLRRVILLDAVPYI